MGNWKSLVYVVLLAVPPPVFAEGGSSGNDPLAKGSAQRVVLSEESERDRPTAVTQKPCPYTCNDAGFSRWGCREWRKGEICYVGPKEERGDQGRR